MNPSLEGAVPGAVPRATGLGSENPAREPVVGMLPEDVSGPLPGVRLTRNGPVATLTLFRPGVLNAQTVDILPALRSFGSNLPGDVRVVVVRGEGSALTAGLRLGGMSQLARMDPSEAESQLAQLQQGYTWLGRPDLVSIAVVSGSAAGPGFQLALACDLRVLTTDAELSMPEVKVGLVPALGATRRLVELVGYSRALDICLTGRQINAVEAERWGLADRVVAVADLELELQQLVTKVLSAPRDAVVEVKALLVGAAGCRPAVQEHAERAAQLRRIQDLAGLGE
jgi:enoyl-CoA hydratase/carnithine racemase